MKNNKNLKHRVNLKQSAKYPKNFTKYTKTGIQFYVKYIFPNPIKNTKTQRKQREKS